jgi:hypothetical protein
MLGSALGGRIVRVDGFAARHTTRIARTILPSGDEQAFGLPLGLPTKKPRRPLVLGDGAGWPGGAGLALAGDKKQGKHGDGGAYD